MIRMEKMNKVYSPNLHVLKDIELHIRKGEFAALMGSSGSGKSTLLHILGCLDTPSSGRYWLKNEDVSAKRDRELAKLRNSKIGFVFQNFHLLPRISAARNVEMAMYYAARPRMERKESAITLLEDVGLGNRVCHSPAKLSGGERQRVAIARALANNPDIILADEPTGNLDSQTGKEIMEIFCKLHEEGKTIVLITHDETIASYSQRVIRFKDGRVDA